MDKNNSKLIEYPDKKFTVQEMVMLARKVDRLEKWILQIAKATGVKLEE